MSCSVYSETLDIVVETGKRQQAAFTPGSALQSPDISRVQLATMLRRNAQGRALKQRESFWSGLMAHQMARTSNTNS